MTGWLISLFRCLFFGRVFGWLCWWIRWRVYPSVPVSNCFSVSIAVSVSNCFSVSVAFVSVSASVSVVIQCRVQFRGSVSGFRFRFQLFDVEFKVLASAFAYVSISVSFPVLHSVSNSVSVPTCAFAVRTISFWWSGWVRCWLWFCWFYCWVRWVVGSPSGRLVIGRFTGLDNRSSRVHNLFDTIHG